MSSRATTTDSSKVEGDTSGVEDRLGLTIVDGLGLDGEVCELLRPGKVVDDGVTGECALPRWFYEVPSWDTAKNAALTPHFTLHEFMMVDLREDARVRRWPRYVPLGITLLAAHLELLRLEVGTLVWVSANGGYRSPAHSRNRSVGAHSWGTAADIYRIGDEFLDTPERIARAADRLGGLCPALRMRPWGHGPGQTDDGVLRSIAKKDVTDSEEVGISILSMPGVGLEAELELVVDEAPARPEAIFGDPRAFLRAPYLHRTGTSYQLATGGAVYFDTGVVEVATPIIEIEPGCAARVGRSLWETILLVRESLDAWEEREGRPTRLVGFSMHYNVSFERQGDRASRAPDRSVEALARMLSYLLPPPIMLLAANRRSTGVGVRPRRSRIEVTVDFTPSPALVIATAAVVTGIVWAAMKWPTYRLREAERRGLPIMADYEPVAHTSRQGWLANAGSYPHDPFSETPAGRRWKTTDGRSRTLREIAWETARYFDGISSGSGTP